MNSDDYQRQAARTLIDEPAFLLTNDEIMLAWNAMGLAGEAGEVADDVKKVVFHRHPFDGEQREKMRKELGDCLWYIAAICTRFGWSLSEVMQANIDKLTRRYPDGYSSDASIHRRD